MRIKTESSLSSYLFLSTLTILGVLGNYFNLTLFFGVDFLFGSIFSFIILATFGFRAALICTLFISSYVFFLWNHIYAPLILILEIILVGAYWKRTKYNLTIAAGVYWFFVGMPLVLVAYVFLLKMSWELSLLAAVKQTINGIFNAIIASLIISFAPARLLPGVRAKTRSVFQTIFNVFVAAALIPSFTILIYDSQKVITQIEDSVKAQLGAIRTEIAQSAVRWRRLHLGAAQLLGKMASDNGTKDTVALKKFMSRVMSTSPAFQSALAVNGDGKIVAYLPEEIGRNVIGTDFSDRPSYKTLKQAETDWFVSPVFKGTLTTSEPMMTISSSIINNGVFEGIVSLSINLNTMTEILTSSLLKEGYSATIIDKNKNVIVSTNPEFKPLMPYPSLEGNNVEVFDSDYFHRWPEDSSLSPMARWAQSSMGIRSDVGADNSWKMFIEIPLINQQSNIFSQYIRLMSLLLFFIFLILLGSYWLATKISNPLLDLSERTSNLPEKLSSGENVAPLQSPFTEISNLIKNFNTMTNELRNRFGELEDSTQRLRRANVLKDEFLATLSHELRTPLNIIAGHAELLKNNSGANEDILFSVEAIDRASKAQTQLVSDLLDVSSITTGKIRFNPAAISLSKIARDLVENLKFSANSKGVTLTTNILSEPCKFFGDETRIQQILWNLISNSIKFTPRDGLVTVDVVEQGEEYILRVKDNGKGIDKEFLPYVFDRFRQEDGSSTRKYGGLGLGLSIVYHLVDLHGGSIKVHSDGINMGSVFEIHLPKNTN